ncbi:DUF2059 domain-containing protein [Ruegeria faecimaris]|uniref:DUF2059 domain-containing protein n=1 Tax=Ruegeria faecimaris TaxID=686389 RepID=UPI00232B5803|nr:DUF2059 domain-containing protein [Ruegeria faecimaris]
MRILIVFALIFWATSSGAVEKADQLAQAMRLENLIEILLSEGGKMSQEMDATLLDGNGGALFETQVEAIYDPDWMYDQLVQGFRQSLDEVHLERAIAFFESDLGQTIVSLENSARLAFVDPAIEDLAKQAYFENTKDSMQFKLVEEYILANDLIKQNVRSALSADYNFFRGINDGQVLDNSDLLDNLLLQKDGIEQETETWLYSFLLMAYNPLSNAQMRKNIAFSRTDTGQALNSSLFESFDSMYDQIYYDLGKAVAAVLQGSDL